MDFMKELGETMKFKITATETVERPAKPGFEHSTTQPMGEPYYQLIKMRLASKHQRNFDENHILLEKYF